MADHPTPTRAIPRQATSAVAHASPPPDEDDPLLAFPPYLHKAPRSNSITPDRQRRFIATLASTGIVKQAAKSIGKSLEALYKLRHQPGAEGFSAAWDAALERGVQRLEDCALERAMRGMPTPIVWGGEIIGHWNKPDNHLLRFVLQHRLPQKYGAAARELAPGHPAYDELETRMRAEVDEIRRQASQDVTARAMALQVYRRRRLYRARGGEGDAAPLSDAWDAVDAEGLPVLPKWGHPYDKTIARAAVFLEEMEAERPF